jgi:hypothetical protein
MPTIRSHLDLLGNIRDNQGAVDAQALPPKYAENSKSLPIDAPYLGQRTKQDRADPKTKRHPPSTVENYQMILMWPCITTMNVQKSVYGPRSAVRGS